MSRYCLYNNACGETSRGGMFVSKKERVNAWLELNRDEKRADLRVPFRIRPKQKISESGQRQAVIFEGEFGHAFLSALVSRKQGLIQST